MSKAQVTYHRTSNYWGVPMYAATDRTSAAKMLWFFRKVARNPGQPFTMSRRLINLNGGHAYIIAEHLRMLECDNAHIIMTVCIGEVPHG